MHTEIKRTALAVGQWRRQHSGPMTALPVELQHAVVKLLETHSWEEVCTAVGINKSRLTSWRRTHQDHLQLRRRAPRKPGKRQQGSSQKKVHCKPAPAFIELLRAEPPGLDVEVKLPTGVVVSMRSSANLVAVGQLVTTLLEQGLA